MPDWLKVTLAILAGPVTMFVFEILLQVQWLGRPNWPIGRMWTNLILVSIAALLVAILGILIIMITESVILAFILIVLYATTSWEIFAAVFNNPAIDWPNPVRATYMVVLELMVIAYGISFGDWFSKKL